MSTISDDRLFKLATPEGTAVTVPYPFIAKCKTLKDMLEDFGNDIDTPIPIHNLSVSTLVRVIEFSHLPELPLTEPKQIPIDPNPEAPVSKQRAFFADMPQDQLFEVILAANYLDYKQLLDCACRIVSEMIVGKTPSEIRTTFNIRNDFSPEEELAIMKENEWINEQ
jgi:S-phase kinase-associated protein 1